MTVPIEPDVLARMQRTEAIAQTWNTSPRADADRTTALRALAAVDLDDDPRAPAAGWTVTCHGTAGAEATVPARIVAKVHQDKTDTTGFPWYYSVDAYDASDPEPIPIDYGSVETRERAVKAVAHVLSHRDRYDNPEYVHVSNYRRGGEPT